MRLEELRVVHVAKSTWSKYSGAGVSESGSWTDFLTEQPKNGFCFESCLRWVWVGTYREFAVWPSRLTEYHEVLTGEEAYRFLLFVATGLKSQILGETDIFGQFKNAWSKFIEPQALKGELSPWVQHIFEDTKEIRSAYVQHLGGSTYGSATRKLLKGFFPGSNFDVEEGLGRPLSVLLVGAGKLTQSILPYLSGCHLSVANRTLEKIEGLKSSSTDFLTVESIEEELNLWEKVDCIILCVPEDSSLDDLRRSRWKTRKGLKNGVLLHLGVTQDEGYSDEWKALEGFYSLDALFSYAQSREKVRDHQLELAKQACELRSKHRSLNFSLSLPHGWEDLAIFV